MGGIDNYFKLNKPFGEDFNKVQSQNLFKIYFDKEKMDYLYYFSSNCSEQKTAFAPFQYELRSPYCLRKGNARLAKIYALF